MQPCLAPRGASVPVLSARGITKQFPGVRALDQVHFSAHAGEVHALMGENGAGKSTLFKVLTGAIPAECGEVRLNGQAIRPASPREAEAAGISTVYQEINLLPHLSVAENICLGRQPKRFGLIDRPAMTRRAEAALARLTVAIDVTRPLSTYSIAVQQMTALARALDVEAKVLILDEPTASLDKKEVDELFRALRRLRGDGLAIVFVSHFLDQVYALADRITVLRNGRLVGEFVTAELPRLELIHHMTGRSLTESAPVFARSVSGPYSRQRPLLAVQGLGRRGTLAPVHFTLHAGEVVGLAGLLGSGRTELARLIFGLTASDTGSLELNGHRLNIRHPRDALAHRFAFTPEDRKAEGIIPHLSVRENIILALQSACGVRDRLDKAEQRRHAARFIADLGIKTPDAETPVGRLSGGNQQKVLLARWLCTKPCLLILDEPTRGIDIGAKAEIERLLHRLREEGMALLFISSELEEVVRLSQRVMVLRDRAKVGELAGAAITLPRIFRLIAAEPGQSPLKTEQPNIEQ